MILCDLCGQAKQCRPRQIEGKEYDICSACWKPLAEKLKGKGRVSKEREMVFLPPAPEPKEQPKPAPPEGPPKIWGASLLTVFAIALWIAPAHAAEPAAKNAAKTAGKTTNSWTLARTSDGQPDLEGYWTNFTYIPLERPQALGNKEFYTEAEAQALEQKKEKQEHSQPANDLHYDNVIWQGDKYAKGPPSLRTSIVFDPPNGQLPPLSAMGQKHAAELAILARDRDAAVSAESRTLGERCITWGADGPPMLGATYNANFEIVQNHDAVVILTEMIHAVRTIWMDGRPHIAANIHQLAGDSRGHWEGDTLVVDSTNFNNETNFRGSPSIARQDIFSSPLMHVVERFRRVSDDTIVYRFTVDDPGTWTQPWSGETLLHKTKGPIFEYACHEGNYGLVDILKAAREKEAAKAEQKSN